MSYTNQSTGRLWFFHQKNDCLSVCLVQPEKLKLLARKWLLKKIESFKIQWNLQRTLRNYWWTSHAWKNTLICLSRVQVLIFKNDTSIKLTCFCQPLVYLGLLSLFHKTPIMEMTYIISFDMCSLMCFYPICTRKDLGLVISSKDLSFAFCLHVLMTSSFNDAGYFQRQFERKSSSRYLLAGNQFRYVSIHAPIDVDLYIFTTYKYMICF